MKRKLFFLLVATCFCSAIFSQTVGQRVKERAKNDANNKLDTKVDNTIEGADNALKNVFKKKNKKAKNNVDSTAAVNTQPVNVPANSNGGTNNSAPNNASANSTITATSSNINAGVAFSDFVPGTLVIFKDDFTQDAMNDFPAKWNSTGEGKVVQLNGAEGRWLQLSDNTVVNPEIKKALPENCTVEFDLFLNAPEGGIVPAIQFGFANTKDIVKQDVYSSDKFWINLDNYNEPDAYVVDYGLNSLTSLGNKKSFPLTSYSNKILHVSMALNKTRLRVYFDQTKIIDLPKIITPEMRNTFYMNNVDKVPRSTAGLFMANLRIASSDVDARSLLIKQLMDEGSATTNEILFDVNSDVIKPQSYEIIEQVGNALKDNPTLKIKITGHTDNDGTAAGNLTLSKKRAASVKNYITSTFKIDDSRIQIDGKGASQPVASNATADGKGKNRRVEFTKL